LVLEGFEAKHLSDGVITTHFLSELPLLRNFFWLLEAKHLSGAGGVVNFEFGRVWKQKMISIAPDIDEAVQRGVSAGCDKVHAKSCQARERNK
jgi:hypothetical protein